MSRDGKEDSIESVSLPKRREGIGKGEESENNAKESIKGKGKGKKEK